MYTVTKRFGHERGLSACFRQWRSTHSHCQHLHGYALSVELVFRSETLDVRNWVIDFGGFTKIKVFLEDTFDHKTVVAEDDPAKDEICALAGVHNFADVVVLPAVGCEQFAKYVFDYVKRWLQDERLKGSVHASTRLHSVTIAEHNSNSATYTQD